MNSQYQILTVFITMKEDTVVYGSFGRREGSIRVAECGSYELTDNHSRMPI
jgi:hypothetical protein